MDSNLVAMGHDGRHRVAGRYARHNGSICNTEARHTVDLQFAIDHRHGITAHFCGARLAPEGAKPVAKETFQLCLVERARCNLAPRERPQSSGVAKNPNRPSNARLAQKQTQTNPVEPIPRTAWQRSWELFHSKASRLVYLDFILP